MASFAGTLALVLHAHFPYVRGAGRWPHGEDALHEVIAESYLPLFDLFHDLHAAGAAVPWTLSVSPILWEQLADPAINQRFERWLEDRRERAGHAIERFRATGEDHLLYLSRFYLELADTATASFTRRHGGKLNFGLRHLLGDQAEALLAPATAAYLSRLDAGALRAQIQTGALALLPHLPRRPRGLWLPYGGFHSDLPALLQSLHVDFLVGPAGNAPTGGRQNHNGLISLSGDWEVAEHVVAPGLGYPGDSLYREFYRRDERSGLHFWRVTGIDTPIDAKALYDPYVAFARAEEHAQHWIEVLRARFAALRRRDEPPVVVVTFDAEFFGHWWFEGVAWLRAVLREIAAADDIRTATLSQIVDQGDPPVQATPKAEECSCASGAIPLDLWARLDTANRRMCEVARRFPGAEGLQERLLAQAAREVLLAASGDWFALIATNSAADYARRRFDEHLDRFERLLSYAEQPESAPDAAVYLDRIAELDNPFPHLNYRLWG
jgi:1,4-alpha-glucan branching enzyme